MKTLFLFLVVSTVALGSESFRFISDGEVIAMLELEQLPANHVDIVQLTFTEKGEELFGFGLVYAGSFDVTEPDNFPRFVAGIDGGLAGVNEDGVEFITVGDLNPPASIISELPPRQFGFGVQTPFESLDLMLLSYPSGSGMNVRVEGHFLAVPEPRFNIGYLMWFSLFAVRGMVEGLDS